MDGAGGATGERTCDGACTPGIPAGDLRTCASRDEGMALDPGIEPSNSLRRDATKLSPFVALVGLEGGVSDDMGPPMKSGSILNICGAAGVLAV